MKPGRDISPAREQSSKYTTSAYQTRRLPSIILIDGFSSESGGFVPKLRMIISTNQSRVAKFSRAEVIITVAKKK